MLGNPHALNLDHPARRAHRVPILDPRRGSRTRSRAIPLHDWTSTNVPLADENRNAVGRGMDIRPRSVARRLSYAPRPLARYVDLRNGWHSSKIETSSSRDPGPKRMRLSNTF